MNFAGRTVNRQISAKHNATHFAKCCLRLSKKYSIQYSPEIEGVR